MIKGHLDQSRKNQHLTKPMPKPTPAPNQPMPKLTPEPDNDIMYQKADNRSTWSSHPEDG
jgi:hypothetical protein